MSTRTQKEGYFARQQAANFTLCDVIADCLLPHFLIHSENVIRYLKIESKTESSIKYPTIRIQSKLSDSYGKSAVKFFVGRPRSVSIKIDFM